MSKSKPEQTADGSTEEQITEEGTTVVQLAKHADGSWRATQRGLDVVGAGASAARATEDMAGKIAELRERGEL